MTPFPLPADISFRKEVIKSWLEDVDDQLEVNSLDKAKESLKIATVLYLSLGPGQGDDFIEDAIEGARVKINKHPN